MSVRSGLTSLEGRMTIHGGWVSVTAVVRQFGISYDLILPKEFTFPFWSGFEVAIQTRTTGACSGRVNVCLL